MTVIELLNTIADKNIPLNAKLEFSYNYVFYYDEDTNIIYLPDEIISFNKK